MAQNKLQFNSNKTEAMLVSIKFPHLLSRILISQTTPYLSPLMQKLSFLTTLSPWTNTFPASPELATYCTIFPPFRDAATKLTTSSILSRLAHCNSVFSGLLSTCCQTPTNAEQHSPTHTQEREDWSHHPSLPPSPLVAWHQPKSSINQLYKYILWM